MKYAIIKSELGFPNEVLSNLAEALRNKELAYSASSLMQTSLDQISETVNRAIKVCLAQKIPVNEHFKRVYIVDAETHEIIRDWKLSRLGYALVLLNGNTENPLVANTQIELLRVLL
ncbi:MAG: hypothetical protein ABJG47_17395 [Ekhidna sp.]